MKNLRVCQVPESEDLKVEGRGKRENYPLTPSFTGACILEPQTGTQSNMQKIGGKSNREA